MHAAFSAVICARKIEDTLSYLMMLARYEIDVVNNTRNQLIVAPTTTMGC